MNLLWLALLVLAVPVLLFIHTFTTDRTFRRSVRRWATPRGIRVVLGRHWLLSSSLGLSLLFLGVWLFVTNPFLGALTCALSTPLWLMPSTVPQPRSVQRPRLRIVRDFGYHHARDTLAPRRRVV